MQYPPHEYGEGKTGAWMYMMTQGMWLYEITQDTVPPDVIKDVERYGHWADAALSARLGSPCRAIVNTTEPLPPGLCLTITCIGPKPPLSPDEVVDELKVLMKEIEKWPIWE